MSLFLCAFATAMALLPVATQSAVATQPRNVLLPLQQMGLADYNAGANVSVALEGSFFETVFTDILPILDVVVTNIEIPGESEKHFSFDSFYLTSFSISSVDIGFAPPSDVVVTLNNLSLSVPTTNFKVFTHIFDPEQKADFKISCSGQFWGSTTGSNATLQLQLGTNSENQLTVTSITPTFSFGIVNINHQLDGFFCKIGQDIIELFLGNLNTYITNLAEAKLPSLVANEVQSLASEYLPEVPIQFASQPVAIDNTIQVAVEILPSYFGDERVPSKIAPTSTVMPLKHLFTDRDVSIGMDLQSFNDLVALGAEYGKFQLNHSFTDATTAIFQQILPAVYNACPNCPLSVDFTVQRHQPPTGAFGVDSMTVTFTNAILGVNAEGSNGAYAELFDVYLNVTFSVENFTFTNAGVNTTVYFQVAVAQFSLLPISSVVPNLNVPLLGELLEGLLKTYIVPKFNSAFTGYPISVFRDGFGLDDWKIKLTPNNIALGANVVIPDV